ncbi:MAG: hypothetical protein H5T61_14695 [Thermoflexales bacterium]|nr:hypothetical protein [Thermoflexales bacterium]
MGRGLRRALTSAAYLILAGLCCFLSYSWAHFWYRGSLCPDNPPEAFQEEALVGVWKADYGRYEWGLCGDNTVMRGARSLVEWLVLREDKTFYQVLQDRRGQIPDQWAQGTWWVERFPDGVTRLHLEKGIFFANEVCFHFPQPPTISGWVSSSDQTGHELFYKQGEEAILIVGWDRFAQESYLEYPWVGSDPPIIVEFGRAPESDSVPIPIPTPGP